MVTDEEEQKIRTAALKNIEAILSARQRAENDLVAAKLTLEKRTEELRQQREWFEVTLASIGDAVITTDVERAVTFLNPVADNLTGWRSGRGTRPAAARPCFASSTKTHVSRPKTRSTRRSKPARSSDSRITRH